MKHTLLASLLSAVVFSLVHPLGSASDLRSDDKFSSGFSAGPQRFDAGEAMLVEFNPYLQDPPKSKATDSFYEILGSPIVGVPGEYLRAVALSEDAQNLLVLAGSNGMVYQRDESDEWQQQGSALSFADWTQTGAISEDGRIVAISSPSVAGVSKIFRWSEESSDWEQMGQSLSGSRARIYGLSGDGLSLLFTEFQYGSNNGRSRVFSWSDHYWNHTEIR